MIEVRFRCSGCGQFWDGDHAQECGASWRHYAAYLEGYAARVRAEMPPTIGKAHKPDWYLLGLSDAYAAIAREVHRRAAGGQEALSPELLTEQ